LGVRESVADVARTMNALCGAIAARVFDHATLEEMTSVVEIPVVNLLSDRAHPCQAVADFLTLQELVGDLDGRRLAYVGDGNNVAASLAYAAALSGVELTVASPLGYELDDVTVDRARNLGGAIELVDEFKGRVAENRRWPAGLQTALEAKEGLPLRRQGRILGSITLQNLIRMYPRRCGMTGTAATESAEFRSFYGLEVVPIPTNRDVIRKDHPDAVFGNRRTKERAVVDAIAQMHAKGRPVLVGTASVAESERLSELVHAAGVPHQVLNARQDAEEASIVALAGQRGAVTISTNMAGRGTDIVLGEGVAELGGLHVIGTNRHESRRIDYQLRGRAGRQGDPGSSQFFLSTQDDLLTRYGLSNWTPDAEGVETVQRVVEGQNFEIRRTLWKYEGLIEMHRIQVHGRRRELLEQGADPHILSAIDSLWADHLANIGELREGIHFRSWGGREPLQEFLADASKMFDELVARIESIASGEEPVEETTRDATWTYLVSDYSLGTMDERFAKGVRRILRDKGLIGHK
jgi:preprotein translocase subunit SecA